MLHKNYFKIIILQDSEIFCIKISWNGENISSAIEDLPFDLTRKGFTISRYLDAADINDFIALK